MAEELVEITLPTWLALALCFVVMNGIMRIDDETAKTVCSLDRFHALML
jgi:hypothetical protein